MQACPIIETKHLRLRPYHMDDFQAYADFYASDRAALMGQLNRRHAWYSFASEAGTWALRGCGYWTVLHKADQALAGHIGILYNDHDPEPELGWVVYPDYEGKGYAYEAAMAARDWLYENTPFEEFVSFIEGDNKRSIALAKRMGAVLDQSANLDDPADSLFRHPKKKDLH